MYLEKLVQCTIVPILTSKVHLQKVVKWTSVPGKTGSIHYCNNTNKSGAPEKEVHWTCVPLQYGTME